MGMTGEPPSARPPSVLPDYLSDPSVVALVNAVAANLKISQDSNINHDLAQSVWNGVREKFHKLVSSHLPFKVILYFLSLFLGPVMAIMPTLFPTDLWTNPSCRLSEMQ